MRLREFSNRSFSDLSLLQYYKDISYPDPTINRTVSMDGGGVSSVMYDVVTPNFYSRRNSGEIINNPMAFINWSKKVVPGTYEMLGRTDSYGDYRFIFEHVPNNVSNISPPASYEECLAAYPRQDLLDEAAAEAWANIDLSEAALIASVGELPETIKWLASVYQRANKILGLYRKKRLLKSLKKVELSELWLELRYAIRPLVFEAEGIVKALETKAFEERQTFRSSVSSTSTSMLNTWSWEPFTSGFYPKVNFEETLVLKHEVRAGVLVQISSDINVMSAAFGLDRPLASMWELVPFSFIMDWFFNIGNIISAWTIPCTASPLTSWVTENITATYDAKSVSSSYTAQSWWITSVIPVADTSSTSITAVSIRRRSPLADRPLIPSMSINLDEAKLLDLVVIGRKLLAT